VRSRGPRGGTLNPVDALERDDLEVARRTSPEDRARHLLAVIRTGFRVKQAALRTRYPSETEGEIETRFRRWLERDDGA
jgi:hypothetical protein